MSHGPVYYNEFDPYAAEWLRRLIARGVIAAGDVDERSIVDVRGDDLRGYRQCHFFAGIGVWSYALRLAGWPDDQPVWTGSCPCQPFSQAGARGGAGDARHLWPDWFALIRDCRPNRIFGEQVASPLGRAWITAVRADVEDLDYALGRLDTCAAGFGSPQGRQRVYWVACANSSRCDRLPQPDEQPAGGLATPRRGDAYGCGGTAWPPSIEVEGADGARRLLPPGIKFMADGLAEGMGQLRAYGNAINARQAAAFIAAYRELGR